VHIGVRIGALARFRGRPDWEAYNWGRTSESRNLKTIEGRRTHGPIAEQRTRLTEESVYSCRRTSLKPHTRPLEKITTKCQCQEWVRRPQRALQQRAKKCSSKKNIRNKLEKDNVEWLFISNRRPSVGAQSSARQRGGGENDGCQNR